MRQRFEKLMEGRRLPVSFGTFHAVFFSILKRAYRYDASNIAREEQRTRIIRELVDKLRMDVEDEAEFTSQILTEISLVKGEMMDLDYYYSKNCSEELFKKLYQGYEKAMMDKGLLDFDDMLVLCYELFTQRKDILTAWQNKYRYILIDEFQDINRVQYEIVRMLAAPRNNLFIVGDDDQSIYRFRGAKPEIMLGFEKDYPQARRTLLGINYRSTSNIVDDAGKLIRHNKTRFDKEIRAARGAGKPVVTSGFADAQAETRMIVKEIQDYVQMGYPYSDIAVLYRTNLEPRLLMERLMEYNIPFQMRDALPNIYEHWITQDLLTYIRMAAHVHDRADRLVAEFPIRTVIGQACHLRHAVPEFCYACIARHFQCSGRLWTFPLFRYPSGICRGLRFHFSPPVPAQALHLFQALHRAPQRPVTLQKTCKHLLSFALHDTEYLRLPDKKLWRIIGNLRASKPDIRLRQYLVDVPYQIQHIGNVPDIAGNSYYIRLSPVNIF